MDTIDAIQMKEYIINSIRKEILAGNIKEGEELVQEGIAKMLGVSRMPVREALLTLEKEGFIKRLPNRHMQVVGIDKKDIISTFHVLGAMEGELATLLLNSENDVEPLLKEFEYYQEGIEQGNLKKELKHEFNVHKQISNLLQIQYLVQIHHTLVDGYFAYMREYECNDIESIRSLMKEIIKHVKLRDCHSLSLYIKKYYDEIGRQSAATR